MPTPPSAFIPPTAMVRSHSEMQGREKALPRAPEPVTRTASEPPTTYVSLRGPPNFGDAHARSMQREAARLAAEAEERAVQREEAVRQARIKEQRAAEARQAEEEELARRAQLERDLARIAAARAAREEAEREEEERREREREERRRRSAERRAEEMRRVEEWMREEERKREEFARAEEELKRSAIERREAARVAAAKRRRESRLDSGSVLLSGWVTVQNPESIAWRRRYFQLTDALLRLYHRQTVSGYFYFFHRNYLLMRETHRIPSPRTSSYSKARDPPSKNGTKGLRNCARSLMHLLLSLPMASLPSCSSPTLLQKRYAS
jgi:chemotaxis protein histidine kinase CheA